MVLKYFIIYIFLVSYNFILNFNLAFLCLVGVASVANFGVGSATASAAFSGFGSRDEIFSKFFIGNYLFLKLLRTFPLPLNNNFKLF